MATNLILLPLVLLATPSTVSPIHVRWALAGRHAEFGLSMVLLCLGMQQPLSPATLNDGEYPACAAMTTGYVFRVENQATVMFLQRIGRTGHLVTLDVGPPNTHGASGASFWTVLHVASVALALAAAGVHHGRRDPDIFLVVTLAFLVVSRLLSGAAWRARTLSAWHGASEPGVRGDLLVLLSQDRWIRLQGLVDDLKAVTSGSWLAPRTEHPRWCDAADWIARMLVYLAVVALGNARDRSKLFVVAYVLLGHAVLAATNARACEAVVTARRVTMSRTTGAVRQYTRRLDMARQLVHEVGRSDFAVKMGLIHGDVGDEVNDEIVTM